MQWLIVTDLDGTLLDDRYPIVEAAAALDTLAASAPAAHIVLASSKTLAEMRCIARRTQRLPSLIFENGGGLAWPASGQADDGASENEDYQICQLGTPYAEVVRLLRRMRHDHGFQFRGFADMTTDDIMSRTGLEREQAELARRRLASEPILWEDSAVALGQFTNLLADAGLTVQQGGRFHHVTSAVSKQQALEYLLRQISAAYGARPKVLACGDAPNDLGLIDNADRALLFPQRNGRYLREQNATLTHAATAGPADWLAGVREIVLNAQE